MGPATDSKISLNNLIFYQVQFEAFKDAFVAVLSNTIDSMAEATEEDRSEFSDIIDTGIACSFDFAVYLDHLMELQTL